MHVNTWPACDSLPAAAATAAAAAAPLRLQCQLNWEATGGPARGVEILRPKLTYVIKHSWISLSLPHQHCHALMLARVSVCKPC
jgi:hypothetical protein